MYKFNDEIWFDEQEEFIKSLSVGCRKRVNVVCPVCNKKRKKTFGSLKQAPRTICASCAHIKSRGNASRKNKYSTEEISKRVFFAKAVKRRDKACVICGSKIKLCAHHLESFKDNESIRYDISNGVTLCKPHHKKFHSWMGGYQVPCTEEDFYYFEMAIQLKQAKIKPTRVGK